MLDHRLMGHVSRGEYMGNGYGVAPSRLTTFGQVYFHKASMLTTKLAKRMEPFDDTGSASPSRPNPGGQCHYGHLIRGDCSPTERRIRMIHRRAISKINHIIRRYIFNRRLRWQPILGQPDSTRQQLRLHLIMLRSIEAVCLQQCL